MSRVIRARRYVSAAVGAYPQPSRVSGLPMANEVRAENVPAAPAYAEPEAPSSTQVAASIESSPSLSDFVAPQAPATEQTASANPSATQPLSAEQIRSATAAAAAEDSLAGANTALGAIAGDAASAQNADLSASPTVDDPFSLEAVSATPTSKSSSGSTGRATRLLAMLLGGVFGAAIGASIGLFIMAYSLPGDPWAHLLDPVKLWSSVSDPVIKISALFVTAGCFVLGLALCARRRRPRRPS